MNNIKNTTGLSRKIKLIILLMILTLAGVVGFQVNFLNNSYKIWSDQFDADVRESLITAVEKGLQRKFVEYTTTVNVPGCSSIKVISVDSILNSGSVYFELIDSDIISQESFEHIHNIKSKLDSFEIEFSSDKLLEKMRDGFDDISEITDAPDLEFKTEIVYQKFNDEEQPIERMEYKIVMNNMVDSFVQTYMYDADEDLYTEFIERLTEELNARSIDIGFNVGVFNFENNSFEYLFPEDTDTTAFETAYKVPLFDKLESPDFASIYFPGKGTYMLQQLWPSILASLLLILITVFSFGYILSTIYRQKKLSEIKNDFINNMTHELKTPITTVSLAVEALKNFNVLESKEQTIKYLNIVDGENNRLSLLVERILKIAAYQREDVKLNFSEIKLHESLNEVIKNIAVQVNKCDGVIKTEFLLEDLTFMADKVHFNNLIYNLIDNALKYSDSKPVISLSTHVDNRGITIRISDNGIGISKHNQEKIFERFYRVSTGNIHKVKGHGLGLSYVKDIVEMHGGTISIQSELGIGSAFSIFLPLNYDL